MLEKNKLITLESDSYTLIKLIGEGGQGVIWQVTAASTGRLCILKTIRTCDMSALGRPQPFDTQILDSLRGRMQEEIDFLRAIQTSKHCFIARCLDHGVIHDEGIDLPAMIMPHYPNDLRQQIPRSNEQRPEYDLLTLLSWLTQLSQALHCTHQQIVNGHAYMHRDIKPPNILLTEDNEIRLIDFGIAKQQGDESGTTSIAHSPAWAAPEQVLPEYVHDNGDNVFRLTAKTDIYSVGLVAYYLCTGGGQPKTQTELSRRSQAIYAQHLMVLRDDKAGLLGEVGGLSEEDAAYLHRRLLMLFFAQSEDDTVFKRSIDRLPLPQIITEQIVDLVTQLLSPQATERPDAETAKKQFYRLRHCLVPRLDEFTVTLDNNELLVGESLKVTLQLNGQGLMRPFDWLQIYTHQKERIAFDVLSVSPEHAVFLATENQVQIRLAAFETTGDYQLVIVVKVGDLSHKIETSCCVKSSASQLWKQGQYKAALKKDLREQWLNILEKKAFRSVKARYDYLQLLETLQQSVTGEKQKEYLAKRYRRAEFIDTKRPFWQQGLLVIAALGIGGWLFKTINPIEKQIEILELVEPEMILIPAGSFNMGCVSGKGCQANEKPVHNVKLAAFMMAKTEVTFAQWDACVKAKGCSYRPDDKGWGHGQRPVINVSWIDAQAYLKWLNKQTGKNYRLPTEAEWEYAARAGSTTKFSWGNEEPSCSTKVKNGAMHNGGEGSDCYFLPEGKWKGTEIVGRYTANAWGLYDMHGNVWEWTCSVYEKSYNGAENRCVNMAEATERVLRGGSWSSFGRQVRSALRFSRPADYRFMNIGLRLALGQPNKSE